MSLGKIFTWPLFENEVIWVIAKSIDSHVLLYISPLLNVISVYELFFVPPPVHQEFQEGERAGPWKRLEGQALNHRRSPIN